MQFQSHPGRNLLPASMNQEPYLERYPGSSTGPATVEQLAAQLVTVTGTLAGATQMVTAQGTISGSTIVAPSISAVRSKYSFEPLRGIDTLLAH